MEPLDYWRKVCAPVIRDKKEKLGRSISNSTIAAAVEAKTGKGSSRQLVEAWFHGDREPYVGQFVALCEKLDLDPALVIGQEKRRRAKR